MTHVDAFTSVDSLKASADKAMMAGNPRGALPLFEQASALAPGRLELWLGLAACRRAIGEPQGSLVAIEQALTLDPRCFPALLMKGSVLDALGQDRPAALVYGNALKLAPPAAALSEPMRKAVARAREVHEEYMSDLVAVLRAEIGLGDTPPLAGEDKRMATFIEAMAGRRKIYNSEPVRFHYPGLPSIEFFERDAFPWLEALEARTEDIRQECLAVWTEGSPELKPYINYADSLPLDQWVELNHSPRWSVYDLLKEGRRVEEHCRQCPATMEAIALLDQPVVPKRSPTALYSILRPRTHIPPHNGSTNTRLLVHLPLIIPEGCAFRVGGETRPWRVGEAWVFDDCVEHEAWNNSDQSRAIMICDVWNPLVPESEREAIARLMAALDRFDGADPGDTI